MKKSFVAIAVLSLFASAALVACGGGEVSPGAPFTVKVLGFNDYHGTLESPGTFGQSSAVLAADRPPVGGADFLAAHIAKLKKTKFA